MGVAWQHYGLWDAVIVWIILFGLFIAFIPFHRKSQRRPTSVYLAFIIALAFEMFGIPLSLYIVAWVTGLTLPLGILWGHTLQQYIGHWGMYIGTTMSLVGAILVILGWEEIHRHYWTKERGEGKLVTDGIYSYIRHPQYAGFLLITSGLLIHWATLPLLIMWPVLVLQYYKLAKREETELEKEFRTEYIQYKKKTSMFIPRLRISGSNVPLR